MTEMGIHSTEGKERTENVIYVQEQHLPQPKKQQQKKKVGGGVEKKRGKTPKYPENLS